MDGRAVSVAPDVAALHRRFDYLVPAHLDDRAVLGASVRVVLHGRKVNGWIMGEAEGTSAALRPIEAVRGLGPNAELLELASWAAWRWASTPARFLRAASPDRNVASLPKAPRLGHLEPVAGVRAPSSPLPALSVLTLGAVEDPLPLVVDLLQRIEAGASLLVVAPTDAFAQRLVARLGRLGLPVAGPGPDQWAQARAGWPLIVGTRSAAWLSVPVLGAALILDAHASTLREEGAPTWSAFGVLRERCGRAGVPLLVATPCPTPELAHASSPVVAPGSVGRRAWPVVTVCDLGDEDPRLGLLSDQLTRLCRRALAEDGPNPKVVVLLNRTGRSKLLVCRSCRAVAVCTRCEAAVQLTAEQLSCPRCHATRPVVCQGCGATAMKQLRVGVTRLAEQLTALLRAEVTEVTAATDTGPVGPVVVGTEAVLSRFRRCRLVVVADVDQHLVAPRMAAADEALALIVGAARMVGARSDARAGSLLLQTRLPQHRVVQGVVAGDVGGVLDHELEQRRRLGLPPYSAIARLRGPGARAAVAALEASGGVDGVEVEPGTWWLQASTTEALCDALGRLDRTGEPVVVQVDPDGI